MRALGLLLMLLPAAAMASPKVVLYSNDNFYSTGNLGNRQVTNGLCDGIAQGFDMVCTATRMLVSYSVADAVKDFPEAMGFNKTGVPVYSRNNTLISDDWETALSSRSDALYVSLNGAGVLHNDDQLIDIFYTGSNEYGEYVAGSSACGGWTDPYEVDGAMGGGSDVTTGQWLAATTVNCDGVSANPQTYTNNKLVCACLNDS